MMRKYCLLLCCAALAGAVAGCSSDSATSETTPNSITAALSVLPQVSATTTALDLRKKADLQSVSAYEGWTNLGGATPKERLRNDIGFNVMLRFMESSDATVAEIGQNPGNESLRDVLGQGDIFTEFETYGDGTHSVTVDGTAYNVALASKDPNASTVVPFDFGITPVTDFSRLRKWSITDLGFSGYVATKQVDANYYAVSSNTAAAESSEGAGTQSSTLYSDYASGTKDFGLYYASRNAYENSSRFIVRLDISANDTSKESTFKAILKDRNGSSYVTQSFSMVGHGKTASASDWVVIKVKYCSYTATAADPDANNCQSAAPTRWFCINGALSMDDIKTFINSSSNQSYDATYTNTAKILALGNGLDEFTGDCLTYKNAIADTAFLTTTSETVPDVTTDNTDKLTYFSTLGYE